MATLFMATLFMATLITLIMNTRLSPFILLLCLIPSRTPSPISHPD
jgi:hypothetical protein